MLVILFPVLAAAGLVGEPISDLRRTFNWLADLAVGLNALCGLAAVLGPFFALVGGRRSAAKAAIVMTSATIVLALAFLVFLQLAAIPETGNAVLFVIPVTLLAGLSCLIWVVVAAVGAKQRKT